MARQRVQQNSLITGVISPTLLGRIDLDKYYNSVEEAENVVIMPHGGMQRRSGLSHLTTVPTGSRLFSFEFSITQNYVFVISTTDLIIYLPESATALATIAWPTALTQVQIDEMDIIQSADTTIITHEDFIPLIVQRQGSDTSWLISAMPLGNLPKYDWDATLTPTFTNYGDAFVVDLNTDDIIYYDRGGLSYVSKHLFQYIGPFTQNVDISTLDLWDQSVKWSQVLFAPATTFSALAGTVVWYDVDGLQGTYNHYYKLLSDIVAGDKTLIDFSDTAVWTDLNFLPLGERTDVWGDTDGTFTDRGWPRTCTFHQARLWFGGSKSKVTSVWGSVINDFFNFDTGGADVQPDDAIFDTLDTNQFNAITNIVSSRRLQVLTSGGEFTNTADILTPSSSAWVMETGYGASRLKPVSLDGATYFMDRFGKTLRGFIYDDREAGYTSPPISILAEHLINDVKDIDIIRGTSISVSNLVYLVNGDGTVAVFNTMRSENIAGWTKWTTNGLFKRVTVTSDKVTFVVERDGVEYLEFLDNTVYLDHAFKATAADRVEVDALLLASDIRVVGDEITQSTVSAVDEAGTYYAYADDVVSVIYAGLNYPVLIKTLPIASGTAAEGNFVNIPRRITKAIVNLYQSRGVYVNGELVTSRIFGVSLLDTALTPITGIESVYLLGYNTKAQVEITQTNPEPLTLLALDLEVSY